jgi:predicted nicotinamide N-methyase
MSNKRKKVFDDYGISVFRSSHKSIRKLKHLHSPSLYGFRVWPSSWLLIDYFKHCRFVRDSKIIDIGCGWGLAGIYCAKNHNSIVTCVDSDAAVFPYLRLHAKINNTGITTLKADFEDLSVKQMKNHQILIGSDICFWDGLVDIITRLILRAFESGIKIVIISDPGRSSFESLGRYFIDRGKGQVMNREVNHPYYFQGKILIIK